MKGIGLEVWPKEKVAISFVCKIGKEIQQD